MIASSIMLAAALATLSMKQGFVQVLLVVYAVMSVVTFIVYGIDKWKAKHGSWRTPEKTLHLLELGCGWPGAMLAHKWLRHKSYKPSFRRVFWCMVFLNLLILAGLLWLLFR